MPVEMLRETLLWCTLINFGLLAFWFGLLASAHDWVYRLHIRWFSLSVERFDSVHYAGMAFYKIIIVLFNLVPLLALHLVS